MRGGLHPPHGSSILPAPTNEEGFIWQERRKRIRRQDR